MEAYQINLGKHQTDPGHIWGLKRKEGNEFIRESLMNHISLTEYSDGSTSGSATA